MEKPLQMHNRPTHRKNHIALASQQFAVCFVQAVAIEAVAVHGGDFAGTNSCGILIGNPLVE